MNNYRSPYEQLQKSIQVITQLPFYNKNLSIKPNKTYQFQKYSIENQQSLYKFLNKMTNYQQCTCNCGTRICLDEQLINQRQEWKQKYLCLQKQSTKDIALMKEKIYQECSLLMQNQFNKKQKQHSQLVNKKAIEIQQLTSRVIKLQSSYKVSQRQKQVLKQRLSQQQGRCSSYLQQLSLLKSKHTKSLNYLQQQNLSQTGILKQKISQQNEDIQNKLINQAEHLKHKVKQFQKKYQLIIPEVQKLKQALNKKTQQVQALEQQNQKLKQQKERDNLQAKRKLQDAIEQHLPCQPIINKLKQRVSQLESDLTKAKLVKKQVKIEPVYVDRPVQVQRVVQKLIQVQRVVKQYIQVEYPSNYKQLQLQNKSLHQQLEHLLPQINILSNRYQSLLLQHSQSTTNYQQNISSYKKQRQSLVKRISQQDQQLEKIYQMMVQGQKNQRNDEDQKIVVKVGKDGKVEKRVEKIINQRVHVQANLLGSNNTQVKFANHNNTSKPTTQRETNKSTKAIVSRK